MFIDGFSATDFSSNTNYIQTLIPFHLLNNNTRVKGIKFNTLDKGNNIDAIFISGVNNCTLDSVVVSSVGQRAVFLLNGGGHILKNSTFSNTAKPQSK